MRFVASYGDIAVMVFNLDEPYLVGCELSFLSEESHDVSFAYFFFFPGCEMECGHWRSLQEVGFRVDSEVGRLGCVFGHLFCGAENDKCFSFGMHAGGASVAVRETFEVDGQVVMYDVFDFGNVESPCGQIGRDADVAAVVAEFAKRPFSVGLFHAAVEGFGDNAPVGEELPYPFHTFTLVAKDEGESRFEVVQQGKQRFQFVFYRRVDSVER